MEKALLRPLLQPTRGTKEERAVRRRCEEAEDHHRMEELRRRAEVRRNDKKINTDSATSAGYRESTTSAQAVKEQNIVRFTVYCVGSMPWKTTADVHNSLQLLVDGNVCANNVSTSVG